MNEQEGLAADVKESLLSMIGVLELIKDGCVQHMRQLEALRVCEVENNYLAQLSRNELDRLAHCVLMNVAKKMEQGTSLVWQHLDTIEERYGIESHSTEEN